MKRFLSLSEVATSRVPVGSFQLVPGRDKLAGTHRLEDMCFFTLKPGIL